MAVKDRLAEVPVLGTALEVQERYQQDASDQLAAAIGFFGFLSLFPLMALAVAAAGFVYADPADQARVAQLITESIPGFQATLGDDDTAVAGLVENVVDNRGTIGLVGGLTLLLTGLRVINAAMAASTVVFRAAVPKGIKTKLWQIVIMVALGLVGLAAVAASSLGGAPADVLPRPAAVVIALAVTLLLDMLLFLAAYRLLRGDAPVSARDLLPGALLAAVGWSALKVAGSAYVSSQVESANSLYGALGGVIALMLLLYLAGRLYLYGAQLSAVFKERREGPLAELAAPGEDDEDDGKATDEGDEDAGRAADEGDGRATDEGDGKATDQGSGKAAGEDGEAADGDDEADDGRRRGADSSPRGGGAGPGSTEATVTAGARTRERLARAEAAPRERADVRAAAGFALGAAALAVAWRLLGGDDGPS